MSKFLGPAPPSKERPENLCPTCGTPLDEHGWCLQCAKRRQRLVLGLLLAVPLFGTIVASAAVIGPCLYGPYEPRPYGEIFPTPRINPLWIVVGGLLALAGIIAMIWWLSKKQKDGRRP